MTGLRGLDERLWVAEHELRVGGVEIGRRMTIVRLGTGELWLHSVAFLTPELRAALDAIGPTGFIVSPNKFHSRYMEQYREAYPGARMLASPGLAQRRPDLTFDGAVRGEVEHAWADDLEQLAFEGTRGFTEIVFHHPATRTLLLTDVCANFGPGHPLSSRIVARALGTYRRLAMPRTSRLWVRDRRAARASADRILGWDFDRVIVGHGDIVDSGGHAAVERAFAWL